MRKGLFPFLPIFLFLVYTCVKPFLSHAQLLLLTEDLKVLSVFEFHIESSGHRGLSEPNG